MRLILLACLILFVALVSAKKVAPIKNHLNPPSRANLKVVSKTPTEVQKAYASLAKQEHKIRKLLKDMKEHCARLRLVYENARNHASKSKKVYEEALKNKVDVSHSNRVYESAKKAQAKAYVELHIAKQAKHQSKKPLLEQLKMVRSVKKVIKGDK